MLLIGLTGGIGAGKSAVSARLASLGAVIIDADRLAREAVAPGTPALREIEDAFGTGMIGADGALDRAALGARVFGDDAARRALEGIVHPRVRARTAELTAAAGPAAIVVNDVPLLVETGLAPSYHLVVVVEAPESDRIARLARTRGMTPEEASARMRAQASDEQRRAVADAVLPNGGTMAELHGRVDALWHGRLRPYEENLRMHRAASAGASQADPQWPQRFARVAARLRHAAGDLVARVDQIGAAAVPGAAADALDVQLGLARPEDGEPLAARLAAAGFPAVTAAPGAEQRHGGADPGEPARVHVRPLGSPRWRQALLMRDWQRAVGPTPDGSAAETEQWVAQAERWAADSGWRP